MRKVIDGKVYDTETAENLLDVSPSGFDRGDFQWESTELYRSPKGVFFIAGEGGARSRWAESIGQNGSQSGSGLIVISEHEARGLIEKLGSAALYEKVFGAPEEG